jgi:hypothetical protein
MSRGPNKRQKPKTNIDLQLAKTVRLYADAGYRLTWTIEKKDESPVGTVTPLEEWQARKGGGGSS